MTDFSVDANGNVSSKSIDNNNGGITNVEIAGELILMEPAI